MKLKFIFLLCAIFVFFSCRKEKTSWDTDWAFPLMHDTLKVDKLINDSTLSIDSDNSLRVRLKRSLLNVDLFSVIDIPDTSIFQEFSINLNQLVLPPGTDYIDEVKEHKFELGDVVLLQARLQSGKAIILIENPINTPTIFTIELPGVSKNGQIFSQTQTIPSAVNGVPNEQILELDLTGYDINMTGENGNSYNKLQSRMTVITDPNGESVTVTQSDVARFTIDFIGLEVDYAKGYFGNTVISDTTDISIDFLKNISDGNVDLGELNLNLTFSNGIKAEAQGIITKVTSTNFNENSIDLQHPEINESFFINRALGSWSSLEPFQKTFEFDEANSNLKAFTENLGHTYTVGYEVQINPWGNNSNASDEIFPNSRIGVDLETDFPLNIAADNLIIIDTFQVDIPNQENILKIKSGGILLHTKNQFPIGAEASITLMDENFTPIGTVGSGSMIQAAQLNASENGYEIIEDELFFELTEDQAKKLGSVNHIQLRIAFHSTQYPENKIFDNAQIEVKMNTRFTLNTEF